MYGEEKWSDSTSKKEVTRLTSHKIAEELVLLSGISFLETAITLLAGIHEAPDPKTTQGNCVP